MNKKIMSTVMATAMCFGMMSNVASAKIETSFDAEEFRMERDSEEFRMERDSEEFRMERDLYIYTR